MTENIQALADQTTPFGFTVEGTWPETGLKAGLGSGGGGIGDFNGDGREDFLVTAVGLDNGARTDAGGVYIVFGGSELAADIASGQVFDPSPSGGGTSIGELQGNGVLIEGALANDRLTGTAAGDVNGDGLADVFLAAPSFVEDPTSLTGFDHRPGTGYILYGSSDLSPIYDGSGLPRIDLGTVPGQSDGSPAVTTIIGETSAQRTGLSLAGGGDLNGDGLADLAIGTFQAPGYAYNPDGSLIEIPVIPGVPGFNFPDDLQNGATQYGRVYALYGDGNMPATIDLTSDIVEGNGGQGFFVNGYATTVNDGAGGQTPDFVATIGLFETLAMADMNGDGRDELLIGAPFGGELQNLSDSIEGNEFAPGGVFIIDGQRTTATPTEVILRDQIFLQGETSGLNFTGFSVANLGDVNGDGIEDVGLSAPLMDDGAETNTGAVYGLLGDPNMFQTLAGFGALSDQADFRIFGARQGDAADPAFDLDTPDQVAGGLFSANIAGVGDVDGDGIDDFAVGFTNASGGNGSIYVALGRPDPGQPGAEDYTPFGDILRFDAVGAGDGRIAITRLDGDIDDQAGAFLGGAVDLDNDGASEFLIGAPGPFRLEADGDQMPLTDGKVYALSDLLDGTDTPQVLSGTPVGDLLEGGDRNDRIAGLGGADALRGFGGDDYIYGEELYVANVPEISGQVFRIYQATLGRDPDSAGHLAWVTQLFEDRTTLPAVAAGFVGSPEFINTYSPNLTDDAFVELLYQNVLGRASDPGGKQAWLSVIADGASRAQVVLGFSDSREFIAATADEAEAFAESNSAQVWSDDVFRLYQATLDRAPDLGGFMAWTGQLGSGTEFLGVVQGFVASTEFTNTYGPDLSNGDFVELLYQNVLDRASDPGGKQNWLDFMANGASRAQVVENFVQSPEFVNATEAPLAAWVRSQGDDDVLDGGAGNNALMGGLLSDTFVLDAGEGGSHEIWDLEPWDTVDFRGFGYSSDAEARANMTQAGENVVFADQGVAATFVDVDLAGITDEMIL